MGNNSRQHQTEAAVFEVNFPHWVRVLTFILTSVCATMSNSTKTTLTTEKTIIKLRGSFSPPTSSTKPVINLLPMSFNAVVYKLVLKPTQSSYSPYHLCELTSSHSTVSKLQTGFPGGVFASPLCTTYPRRSHSALYIRPLQRGQRLRRSDCRGVGFTEPLHLLKSNEAL